MPRIYGIPWGQRMFGKIWQTTAVTLLLALVGTGTALAQRYDGSGLVKFGVFGQGTFLNVDQSSPAVASSEPSGFAGGVSAGYDFRLYDRWLLGVEIDGSFGDARARAGLTDYGFDYLMTARGRLGVYVRPDWLLYGTAGVGYLGVEAQRPGLGNKAAETMTGYVVGAGTEFDWHHVILFGEYLYGDFGERNFTLTGSSGLVPTSVRHDASIDAHLVRLGIKFKVGHDYAHDYDHPEHHKRGETLK